MGRNLGFGVLGAIVAMGSQAHPALAESRSIRLSSGEMIGEWVTSDIPPSGKLEDICATDESDWFLPAGRYEGLFEVGTWSMKNRVLTITVTLTNHATGGEGALKRLTKPEVRRFTVETVQNGVAKIRTPKGLAWLVRCKVR
jgi:hypothetical protein